MKPISRFEGWKKVYRRAAEAYQVALSDDNLAEVDKISDEAEPLLADIMLNGWLYLSGKETATELSSSGGIE